MFKSVQIKIILIVSILAILMFAIPGYLYINHLTTVDTDKLYTVINNGKLIFSIIVFIGASYAFISFTLTGTKTYSIVGGELKLILDESNNELTIGEINRKLNNIRPGICKNNDK